MSKPFSAPDPAPVVPPAAPRHDSVVAAFGVSALVAATAGAAAGLVWGGIGGRIAMRVVFLTSDERVRGLMTDDEFEIGRFSAGDTIFLLIGTTIFGWVAGLGVGIIRMVTSGPTWAVAIGTSLATAASVGASIVDADGRDFRLLEPLWLTVGLFVLIPGLWGATVIVGTDRIVHSNQFTGPPRVHRRYWGATGWILLVGITIIGIRDLLTDIATLT